MAELALPGAGESVPLNTVMARLSGIEEEMRAVRGFLERLVRVEERREADAREIGELRAQVMQQAMELAARRVTLVTLRTDLDGALSRLDGVQKTSSRSAWAISGIERLFWILATAVAGVLAAAVGARIGGGGGG